jgi:hypothetical protein
MPSGPAHILEVIVLAAGAHALLGGGRPRVVPALLAQEYGLELDHAGIGEQEGGILGRHQRRGADHTVAVPREVVEEALANLGARLHGRHYTGRNQSSGVTSSGSSPGPSTAAIAARTAPAG